MSETGDGKSGDGTGGNGSAGAAAPQAPGTTAPQAQPKPLFYTHPEPLTEASHAGKGLRQPIDYRFAAKAHAVVLQTQEFRLAAAHYPIVFADDGANLPLAVLGLSKGENLFVDSGGQWRADTYIPAYVRRYPFVSGQGAKAGEMMLYIDGASDLVVDMAAAPGAAAFFVDGKPSEAVQQALNLCAAFEQQVPHTQAFVAALKAHNLLQSKEVRLDMPGGGQQTLGGLRIVDEAGFDALPDDVFLDWRRKGWVAQVYWHWMSMDNFRRMTARG